MADDIEDNEDDILTEARERFERVTEAEAEDRDMAQEDYEFARLGDQWPEEVKKQREIEGRPCLTLNRMPSFIRQVVNDARQMKPSIRVHPVDSGADVETAEIINGLIRNIEYISDASAAYDTAVDHAVSLGFGYFRINVDYTTNDSFDKDIRFERIYNPFSVYRDPDSVAVDSSDWNYCFITEWVSNEEFQARYPNAAEIDWDFLHDADRQQWFEQDHVLVAEYWTREEVTETLLMLSDGQIMFEDEYENGRDVFEALGVTVQDTRDVRSFKVKQYFMNGQEVLEENDWPGEYIPIVPVYGDEVLEEGARRFRSLTHDARDAQQMYNFWRTATTELVALAPKSPWIGEEGTFDVDDRWETANVQNHAYLEYARGKTPPQRQPFASVPQGAFQEALSAQEDMKGILGMYDEALGQQTNAISGVAINNRRGEADNATFHFLDNLARAIRHAGRIIVDLIPHVYTRARIVRVLGEDDEPQNIPINQPVNPQTMQAMAQDQMEFAEGMARIFDLTTGKYDVVVKVGPSYATKRQEAADQMMQLVTAFPQAAPIIGDLVAKNLDWPGSDEIAKRLKTLLPNEISGEEDPRIAQMQQQIQALTTQLQAAMDQRAIEQQKVQIDGIKAETDREEARIKAFDAETKRLEAQWKYSQGNDANMIDLVQSIRSAKPASEAPPMDAMGQAPQTPRGTQ